jgi:hypothetical protein
MTEDAPTQAPPVEDAIAQTAGADSWTTAAPPKPRDPVPVLIAIAAIFLVTTILFGLMAFAPRIAPIKSGPARLAVRAQEEAAITAVAKRFAKNFLTVDYRTIDADFRRVTSDATGKFKEQLQKVLTLSKQQFKDRRATSSGSVTQTFMLSNKNESAVVRAVVNRTIQNARTKSPQSGVQVLDITLVKTSDGWKVDDLRQLGAEGTN